MRGISPKFAWSWEMYQGIFRENLPPSEQVQAATRRQALLAARQYRKSYPLHQFVEDAWPLVEPQPFINGWHIDAVCQHLEAVTETAAATDIVPSDLPEIRNLLINVPPRSSKSLVSTVLWPAWVWLTWPACRWLCSSYDMGLSLSHATTSRMLMQTAWYDALKQVPWTFTSDQRVKAFFSNSAHGYRISTSVGGKATGFGADIRCLSKKERILTEEGWIPIGEIVERRLRLNVFSYNHRLQVPEWQPITEYMHSRLETPVPVVQLQRASGHYVASTLEHPVFAYGIGYLPAGEIVAGDQLLSCQGHGHLPWADPVVQVTPLAPIDDIYNLKVARNNNYFAEHALLHNCGDDLHDTREDFSTSRAEIIAAKQHWLQTMASRTTNAKRGCQVLNGQRVGIDDVSAAVLEAGDYAYLKIPMEYEPQHVELPTPLGWVDPRTEPGALMAPERFGLAELAPLKRQLGHRYFTQFQQRPISEHSSLYPRDRWRVFHAWPDLHGLTLVQSIDARFKDDKDSGSYVAIHVWARSGPPDGGHLLLLDRECKRLSFQETIDAILAMSAKWPGAYVKLVENKANGPAIYNVLRSKIFGLVLVQVDGRHGSKYARAEAQAIHHKEGRAWLPSPDLAYQRDGVRWVEEYMTWVERFPGEPDDDMDATSQAWAYLCPLKPTKDLVREQLEQQSLLARQIAAAQQKHRRRIMPAPMVRVRG